jgi:hypothetical protein
MNQLIALLCFALCSCTLTMSPTRKQATAAHHRVSSSTKSAPKTTLVDAQWMARYKQMEADSNYPIRQDADIKPEGDKYRVPQAVIDHNQDLFIGGQSP